MDAPVQVSHGPRLPREWEGCLEDDLRENTLYESTLQPTSLYVRPRGNISSMTLKLLPPVCVAEQGSRESGGRGEASNKNLGRWGNIQYLKKR